MYRIKTLCAKTKNVLTHCSLTQPVKTFLVYFSVRNCVKLTLCTAFLDFVVAVSRLFHGVCNKIHRVKCPLLLGFIALYNIMFHCFTINIYIYNNTPYFLLPIPLNELNKYINTRSMVQKRETVKQNEFEVN